MDAKGEAEVQGESVYKWCFEEINGLTVCKQSCVIFLPRTGQFNLSHTATVFTVQKRYTWFAGFSNFSHTDLQARCSSVPYLRRWCPFSFSSVVQLFAWGRVDTKVGFSYFAKYEIHTKIKFSSRNFAKFCNNNFAEFRKKLQRNFAESILTKIIDKKKKFAKFHSFLQVWKTVFIRHHHLLIRFIR
jgi:hypothetical protein